LGELRVLLLSGLLCDQTVWARVAQRLSSLCDVDIISFANFHSIESMAEHVLDTAPQKFVLVGHSMGGRVALEVWHRAAYRVRALALCNTGVHPRRDGESASRARLVALAQEAGMRALAAEWLPPMMCSSPRRIAEILPGLTAMVERQTPESFAGQIRALLERPDARYLLPTINVPTLLMSASGDNWSPLSQHEDMKRNIANSSLVEIGGAGHLAPVEKPAAVAAALRTWLDRLSL
jgi:pimeloyl-ACP methyl ester carboxylesterase